MSRALARLRAALVLAAPAACVLALTACPPSTNPPRLWLAPNRDELHVQLVPIEPNPF
jgi:hypothetical protein